MSESESRPDGPLRARRAGHAPGRRRALPSEPSPVHGHGWPGGGGLGPRPPSPRRRRQAPPRAVLVAPSAAAGAHSESARPPGRSTVTAACGTRGFGRGRSLTVTLTSLSMARGAEPSFCGLAVTVSCRGPGGLVSHRDGDSSWRIVSSPLVLSSPRRLLFSPRTLQRRGAADCCGSAPQMKARKPPNSAYYLRIGL
jgi:hypothetical protein